MDLLKQDINFSSKTAASLGISFVYLILLIMAAANHEPFCDELNVYMAIQHFDFMGLAKYIFNDGNLPGFYAFSYLPAKIGLPFASIQVLCAFFSAAAVFLLLNFSPFPFWFGIGAALSAPLLYFFPIIVRPYSLLPFLIAGAAASWPGENGKEQQHENIAWPIFAFFAVCIALNHVVVFMFAFCLLLMFLRARLSKCGKPGKMTVILSAAISAALLFVIAESLNAVGTNAMYSVNLSWTEKIKSVIMSFFAVFFDSTNSSLFYHSSFPDSGLLFGMGIFFSIFLFFAALIYFFFIDVYVGLAAAASVLFPLYVYLTHYSVISPNRVYITHLMFLFFLWISLKKDNISLARKKCGIAIMAAMFFVSIPASIYFYIADNKNYFSSAEKAAEYINSNVENDGKSIVVATVHWQGLSVAHYSEIPIYQLDGSRILFYGSKIAENRLAESGLLEGKEWLYIVASKYQSESLFALGYEMMYYAPKSMLPEEDYAVFRKKIKN